MLILATDVQIQAWAGEPMRNVIQPARYLTVVAFVLWLSAVAAGGDLLWRHALTPGSTAAAPTHWPTDSLIKPEPGLPMLVMLAHPQCACTRASLGELALIMAKLQGKLKAYVVFYQPVGFPASWVETDTEELIANVRVLIARAEASNNSEPPAVGVTLPEAACAAGELM